jgi:hypothetical protein
MRFMMMVKANTDTERGVMPDSGVRSTNGNCARSGRRPQGMPMNVRVLGRVATVPLALRNPPFSLGGVSNARALAAP